MMMIMIVVMVVMMMENLSDGRFIFVCFRDKEITVRMKTINVLESKLL